MKTTRHYFISDDLDDLDYLEEQLEEVGIEAPQIHVLSHDHTGVASHHHLHEVASLLETDVVHSWEVGAVVGVIGAIFVLAFGYLTGLTEAASGWVPFIFLSIVVLGFCTWEGGFVGFQQTNHHYKDFQQALDAGKHIFFVDALPEQEAALAAKIKEHPSLEVSLVEQGAPSWIFSGRKNLLKFTDRNLLAQEQLQHK